MKSIKIEIPKGYKIDKEQSTFENIVFKPLTKYLPKTWEELEIIDGYYATVASTINGVIGRSAKIFTNKNTFTTKEQAEASIALAQLSQLMKVYNDGWVPDWKNDTCKYTIRYSADEISRDCYIRLNSFLAFKTNEIRDEFLENFIDLITIAKPLL